MAELARDADAAVHLVPFAIRLPRQVVSAHTTASCAVPLMGITGSPVATVLFETAHPMVSNVYTTLRIAVFLIFAGVGCVILAVGWALNHWVGRPLATITEALHEQQPALLSQSVRRHDEFGRLARLVEEFFVQRDKLIAAREAATLAMASKSQFLANISHELRTPMHGILSYSRFGLKGALTAEREELLDDFQNIESCGASLLSLLDDLLDLSKLEAGRMRFEFEATPLEEIVADAVDEFASVYDEKALRVEVRAEDPLEPVVVDRGKIMQVIRNLLSNAGKFTSTGGTVWVRIATAAGLARVVVEDSGSGIPESDLELIFEKFVQAGSIKKHAGGTGLGLAICREIVAAHGGRIWAENRTEGGARITFQVPLEGPPVAAEPDILQTASGDERSSLAATPEERRDAA